MSYIPRFKIYDSTGVTLLHTFEAVQDANYPHSSNKSVEITSQRAKGSVFIDGGDESWEITIRGILMSDYSGVDGYEEVISKADAMESAIALNTPYILKINKTETTHYEYKVKRINEIIYDNAGGFRINYLFYECRLIVNSW